MVQESASFFESIQTKTKKPHKLNGLTKQKKMERKSEHITKNKHRFSNEIYLRPWILKAVDVNKSCSD